ncbi:hypothetical protein Taro_005044 [Colocasia esculenta]|uniref:Uncharacterized protein n=1 Tax=Colocasia esculenta TaxID=4460 RepID=A0A843TRB3_COLES|nr:hypothetical protein [Colocasia esculenta]
MLWIGVSVQPMGRVRLPITLGTAPRVVTKIVDFLVINNMPGYNAILGRGLIGRIKAVPSSLHQKMKFPTPSEVGKVLGCQRESRRCYVLSLRDKRPLADPAPPAADQPSTSRGTPAEGLIPVQAPWTTVTKEKYKKGMERRRLRSMFGRASTFIRRRHPPRLELCKAHIIQTGIISATPALPNSGLESFSGTFDPR